MESNRPSLPSPSARIGFGIFLVGLAIRMLGIGWGLPGERRITSLHPDEPINWMVTRAATDLTPNFYNYGTLFFTINNAFLSVMRAMGLGASDPNQASLAGIAQEISTGRFISALFGAGIAWIVFSFLFKRVGWTGALLGALAAIFAPGMVVHSRFMTVDIMSAFFVLACLYWSAEAIGREEWRPYILAGLFAGLAAGSKYNGVVALVALTPALFQLNVAQRLNKGAAAIGVCILTFLVCVPGFLFERESFWRDFNYELGHTAEGHGLVFVGTSPGIIFHWSNLFVAFGFFLTVIGLVGLARAVTKRHDWAIALGLFFVVYFLLIARAEVKFMRYVFPLIPVLCIGFGWLMGRMQAHPDRKKWSWGVAFGIFALSGVGRGGVGDTATATMLMMEPDPRDKAALALESSTSVGLVADPWYYTPSLYPQTVAPRPVPFESREQARLEQTSPTVLRFVPDDPSARLDWDPRLITELQPQTIVFSAFEKEGYDRLALQGSQREDVQRYKQFATLLTERYVFETSFGGLVPAVHDYMYINPRIEIWKRKSTNSSTTLP